MVFFSFFFFFFSATLAAIRNPSAYLSAIVQREKREFREQQRERELYLAQQKKYQEAKRQRILDNQRIADRLFETHYLNEQGYLVRRTEPVMMIRKPLKSNPSPSQRAAQQAYLQRLGASRAAAYGISRGLVSRPAPPTTITIRTRRGSEVKGMDTDITLAPVITTTTTNASSFVLNLVQQGTGSWNRVGRKIQSTSLRIKGAAGFNLTPTFATGAAIQTFLRMIVLWDHQPSGAALPTFDSIFGITDQTGTESTPDITNPLKYDVMDRFRVIRDWCISCPPIPVPAFGTGPNLSINVPVDEFIKLKDLETNFSGQSNPMTIADINTGGLYLYMRAYSPSATTSANFDGIARLRYND